MKATYWQRGETLDYTPASADVENGQVIDLGTRIGVAGTNITKGQQGQIHVVGVFAMDKKSTEAVQMGAALYYNATDGVITASADNGQTGGDKVEYTPAGYAAADAAAADATVLVKLLG